MLLRIAATRRSAFRLASMLCALGLVLAGCSPEHYPQTSLRPLSDFARIGDDIQMTTFWWALGVFILVEGALVYAIFRFRGRPDDAEPRQIHGNTTVEIIWTAVPALILAAIAVPTVKGIFATAAVPHTASVPHTATLPSNEVSELTSRTVFVMGSNVANGDAAA